MKRFKWGRDTKSIKKKIWVNKAYNFKEAEKFDTKFWHRAGVAARFSAVWDMVNEFLKMKGQYGNKP